MLKLPLARIALGLALAGSTPLGGVRAQDRQAVPIDARIEISFLLGYVEGSTCAFYRNGTWHAAAAAQAHLRSKYGLLAARRQIGSAEDFIDKVATRSSLTGEAYAVRCAGSPDISSDVWFRAELARLRVM
jgi:hypothetical protein